MDEDMLLTSFKATFPAWEPLALFFLVVCSTSGNFSPGHSYTFTLADMAQELIMLQLH